mgnify:CR=1 FL=1
MTHETIESLTEKLLAAYSALSQLSLVRKRALPLWVRALDVAGNALPLGMIPITLIWTAIVFFAPTYDPIGLIRMYAIGLLVMLLGAGLICGLRLTAFRQKLPDEILGDLALLDGLAYHPNAVLRRSIAARGYATLGEFLSWHDKQKEILDTRVSDYLVAIDTLRRGTAKQRVHFDLPPGARAFLDS